MEGQKVLQFPSHPSSAYDILLEQRERFRQMISDGDVRCLLQPCAMTAYCEHLLETRPSCELSVPFGEFRRREIAQAKAEERTKFEVFWNEIYKYLIYAITVVDEIPTGQILNLICHSNGASSSATLCVNFPCPPSPSCFAMYSKQERIVNENLTDDEIKKTWDAMLPRHRIPLFEQYKLELTTFLGNLNDFLQRTPQLGEQQKLHIKNIMSRTSTAVQQVDEILNKLKMRDIEQSASALKYFKENSSSISGSKISLSKYKKVGIYYNDIPDGVEREQTIQEEFEALPKRVVAWMARQNYDE